VPGWTLPGVFTVGGAQALLKSQRIRPGGRMLVAGVGPLLRVVASQMAEAGVEVVAVAEPAGRRRMIRVLPSLAREWPLLRDGIRYHAALARKRVPWLARTNVVRIEGRDRVTGVQVSRVDAHWRPIAGTERRFDVDAVALGYGLIPSIELPRLCGCAIRYDRLSRTWLPVRTPHMESTVPGIYIAGDGAGIAGAVVAAEEGRIAGIAAAAGLGRLPVADAGSRISRHQRRCRALGRLRLAMERAFSLEPGLYELAQPDTIICRCEEVRLQDLEDAVADGADSPASVKSFTRCGMGMCQGRMCGAATAEWLAARLTQDAARTGLPSVAPPAKPLITLGSLAEG
jgi:bacterioferritin-associated ferredoxin